ncbi:hypothetical protein PQS90_04035 [Pseudomonas sp. BLCC-B13]|uniref:hypothetical protein n=1 Tax=Pseudomonas sp. BLCC-B13 TaxID=3025314 RepID=UPI00234E8FC2|nr:hypothetical protein [Pseudomonas sp. BLCC-B13]MDC7824312.1 hypothetical protein [Pseudomonas sp. BLCC-B13]
MDWQYWITTAIALLALAISWAALKHSKQSSRTVQEHQKRLEQYEHYPIVRVTVTPVGERIKVTLANTSAKNAVSSYQIKIILRITSALGKFSREEYTLHRGGLIAPNTEVVIDPSEINTYVADFLPVLKNYTPDQYNFVLRAEAECAPPHPKADIVHEHGVGYFSYEQDRLQLKSEPTNFKQFL